MLSLIKTLITKRNINASSDLGSKQFIHHNNSLGSCLHWKETHSFCYCFICKWLIIYWSTLESAAESIHCCQKNRSCTMISLANQVFKKIKLIKIQRGSCVNYIVSGPTWKACTGKAHVTRHENYLFKTNKSSAKTHFIPFSCQKRDILFQMKSWYQLGLWTHWQIYVKCTVNKLKIVHVAENYYKLAWKVLTHCPNSLNLTKSLTQAIFL